MTTYLEKTGYRDKTEYVYDETNNKHYTAEYQKSHVNVILKKKTNIKIFVTVSKYIILLLFTLSSIKYVFCCLI